ncbi:translocation/assembly module TamB domain-containing protein [Ferruginibacter albus]|uniref:translocation/assembly module TamB domain-containing protein n=1 Tax=Ferruginibacter albus TaxID=2875540 RepID=UPI001CC41E8B|nr:translocation/assembly module TamB domain-containing protein [Ferruginibacter albus]UAY52696.1 translocation/assembly module TamB domain-containing protein [Ferruginibacter albus]
MYLLVLAIFTNNFKYLRKFWKILKRFVLAVLLLLVFLYFILQVPAVQTWVIHRVTGVLSENLHTKVEIKHIAFSFFAKMDMQGLLIRDRQQDTLVYAGSAKVNITDWFFLKDKAVIQYAGLTDVTVNMKRTDSVWNYQFLADYFSSDKKDTSTKAGLQLDIKKVYLKNVHFNNLDGWVGKDMRIGINEMNLVADSIDFKKKKLVIQSLDLDAPSYSEYFYEGKRKASVNATSQAPEVDSLTNKTAEDSWFISVKNLQLNNGSFASLRQKDVPGDATVFDGENILFSSITGSLKNVLLQKDTLTSNVHLSAKERCGFILRKIDADFTFAPTLMEFKNLDLVTNRSHLKNYYAMHYNDFTEGMDDFSTATKLNANFDNSVVYSDDIAFFTSALKTWKRQFNLSGTFDGMISNFSARKMKIKSGNSSLDGDITMNGLTNINNTFIDFKSNNLQTSFADVSVIVPSLKKIDLPRLNKLTNIQFKGNFTGFLKDFVAFGSLNTNLGVISGDVNLKFPDNGAPAYSGVASTPDFQLGQFIGIKDIGNIAFNGKINGSGFAAENVNTNFDGTISKLEYNGYAYKNINVKGDFKKRLFNGDLSINDPNLKLDTLQGRIDLTGKEPQFDFSANLTNANFKQLNLTKDDFTLGGNFKLNFSGSNIDNFIGAASINNAKFLHNGIPVLFDSLILRSELLDNEKILTLQSNEIAASVSGKFKIVELPEAFKVFLNHYYPSYIETPDHAIEDQDFRFQIKTQNVDSYFQLMDKKLGGFNNATISGNLALSKNNLSVLADLPEFTYDGKRFTDIHLESSGNQNNLLTKVNVSDITLNDSMHLPSTSIVLNSHNDYSDINIKTKASKTLSDASLNATVQTLNNEVKIHFQPSSFIVNDKEWDLDKDGELTLGNSQIVADNIRLSQGTQEIKFSTQSSSTNRTNDVVVNLSQLNINDVAPFVVTDPKLEGTMTGSVVIADLFKKPVINYNVKADQFRVDNDSIGTLFASANYNSETGTIRFAADGNNPAAKLNIKGTINLNDSTDKQTDISFIADKFDLNILNTYLGSVFNDIKGYANTSDLRITGNGKHPYITGTATLNDASIRVNYTQCRYDFNNATVIFNPDEIDIGNIKVRDSLGNQGLVSGKMYHNFFKDFEFDNLHFETDKMLVLNTTKKDNNLFFGKVFGRADLTLNGPITNMQMSINGETSSTDSSHITLLSDNNSESKSIDYIDFIQFGKQMGTYKGSKSSNITVDMNLSANPACKIDVVLDETTGDIIKGEGYCNQLNIRVGTNEPLTIRGRYDITDGEYTFNFQKFLKKPFTLSSGSSITWTKDPYTASIDITAEYLAKNVDFSSIPSISSTSGGVSRLKSDLNIIAHLTKTLNQPYITFELELPPSSPSSLRSDVLVTKRLQDFKNDVNEMNKQVASLLMFNTFINSTQSFISASSGYNVLSGTLSSVISNYLAARFNAVLQRYGVKNATFYFNSNSTYGTTAENNAAKIQGAIASGVVLRSDNGRWLVSIGINLDYNDPYLLTTNNNNVFVTPDVTAEYLISQDGRIRLVGFNNTSVDINGQRNRSGLKLSYQKDFDKKAAEEKKTMTVDSTKTIQTSGSN